MKFTLFLTCLVLTFFTSTNSVNAQSVGDFQTNGTGGGDWTTIATWQTWNGSAWVAASGTPDATSGVITILSGDSVALTSAITIDQVVVASGGVLAMGGGGTIITLNNTGANDIDNSGTVRIVNGHLNGTGNFLNRPNALLSLQSSGWLGLPQTTNNGQVQFSNNAAIGIDLSGNPAPTPPVLTNNNLINWLDNSLFLLNAGSLVNNDSIAVLPTGSVNINNGTSGTFTNAGVVYLKDPALNLTATTPFNNNGGTIRGFGTVNFSSATGNSNTGGIFIPGNDANPTILNLAGTLAGIGSPTYKINLVSTGAVAGTNYSQVAMPNGVNLASSTLTVTDLTSDAAGTTYTLMTSAGTNFTGTFATVNLPPSIGMLSVSGTTVTVQKVTTLPLTWGSFTVKAAGSQAVLNWSTLQESNTDAFIIERSTDGVKFSPIGTVKAQGNSSQSTAYTFTDASPAQQGYNYYRLQQTDLDGKSSYSSIVAIGFGSKSAVAVQTSPNPVKDLLNITVTADNVMITVTDMNGRNVKLMRLNPGFHQTSTSDLAPGAYQLTFYQGSQKIGGQQLIKL